MVVGVRFQVSQVLDTIEQRLTTDVTGAQAVADLTHVVRNAELDRGRPGNLVRIGMVVDALSRYLVDGGAMLYGVVERGLLSESALTSKERMVLGRWADDGLIEVTPGTVEDRVVEIADLTGLPLITTQPYPELAERFRWLADGSGRVLLLTHRAGVAALRPMDDPTEPAPAGPADQPEQVVGRASIPGPAPAETAEAEAPAGAAPTGQAPDGEASDVEDGDAATATAPVEEAGGLPLPVEVFADRGARVTRTRISWRRFRRAEPSRPALLRRQWRCEAFECPCFGEHRRIGQPVPRMRGEIPTCPRHDQPVVDAGARQPAYAVSIVVDDLPRRRLVVRGGEPLQVGRAEQDRATVSIDPPEVVSVAPWLHQAAAAWVSPVHLRLEATDAGLVVTDLSENGVVVWQRKAPDDLGTARPLRRDACALGEWDSVELYTGIELIRADRRLTAMLGRDELESVLVDAPTAAHKQIPSATGRTGG